MSILSDRQILEAIGAGDVVIEPFDAKQLGSNSYDVKLGKTLVAYEDHYLDPRKVNRCVEFDIPENGIFLQPNKLYLGVTEEFVGSRRHVPFLDGKSSVGRLGICVHITAGRGDVGFHNHWTMEIAVVQPVKVYAGMPIGQFIFFSTGDVLTSYDKKEGAKYNGRDVRPVPSKMWRNFEGGDGRGRQLDGERQVRPATPEEVREISLTGDGRT